MLVRSMLMRVSSYLSPYTPSSGFGVNEYPLPAGAEIIQLQVCILIYSLVDEDVSRDVITAEVDAVPPRLSLSHTRDQRDGPWEENRRCRRYLPGQRRFVFPQRLEV